MSKFRARQLDATKPIAIYFQEDISDCSEFNNVTNRTVPQLPTGMEKEEETEHHLQQAIFHQRVIPVPEVFSCDAENGRITFNQLYPANYKLSRQMVHIHPFSADQDVPDYDMDSEDEKWLDEHTKKGELLPIDASQFEEMMDRLEKASGLKAVTLQEAKLLLKDDDDLITAVFDYWLNKRLRLQHPLILQVRSDKVLNSTAADPYVAFRKRTEKMQTRKNRKNDEISYEKMLKLRRDLMRAINLLQMIKKREKLKRENLHLNIEVHEKRYEIEDFSGAIINEINAERLSQQISRGVFSPIPSNNQNSNHDSDFGSDLSTSGLWVKVHSGNRSNKDETKRRPYRKKRKLGSNSRVANSSSLSHSYTHPPDPFSVASLYSQGNLTGVVGSMDDEDLATLSETEDVASTDGHYGFRRKSYVNYHAPREPSERQESPPFCRKPRSPHKHFYVTSLTHPTERIIGLARRRVGRGGRIWLDRIRQPLLDPRLKRDTKDLVPGPSLEDLDACPELLDNLSHKWPHFYPRLPALSEMDSTDVGGEESDDADIDVETVPPSPVAPSGESSLFPSGFSTGAGNEEISSLLSSGPSCFYITAEVVEGLESGSFTDLSVSIPPPSAALLAESTSDDDDDDATAIDHPLEEGRGKFSPAMAAAAAPLVSCSSREEASGSSSSSSGERSGGDRLASTSKPNSDNNFNFRSSPTRAPHHHLHPPPSYSCAVGDKGRVDCDTLSTGIGKPGDFTPLPHHVERSRSSRQNLGFSNFQTQPSSRFSTRSSSQLPCSSIASTKTSTTLSTGTGFTGFTKSQTGSSSNHILSRVLTSSTTCPSPQTHKSSSHSSSSAWVGVESSPYPSHPRRQSGGGNVFSPSCKSPKYSNSASIPSSSFSGHSTQTGNSSALLSNSVCGDIPFSSTTVTGSTVATTSSISQSQHSSHSLISTSCSNLLSTISPPISSHTKVDDLLKGGTMPSNYHRGRYSSNKLISSNLTLQNDSASVCSISSSSSSSKSDGNCSPSTSIANLSSYRSSGDPSKDPAVAAADRLQLTCLPPSELFNISSRNNSGALNSSVSSVSRKIISWTTDNLVNDVSGKDVVSNGPSSKTMDSFGKCPTKINAPPAIYPET